MSFLVQRRMVGFKLETTPYTVETLAATDFNLCAWDINYDPDIAMMARKCAKGNFGKELSIAGKRKVSISFVVTVQEGEALGTAPTYYKCLRACAMKQTDNSTIGTYLDADSDYTNVPATIEVVEKDEGSSADGIVIRAKGAMGNARLVVSEIGEPLKIEFEFQGVLQSIERRANASMLVPTGFNTSTPDAVMGVTMSAHGDIMTLNAVTIDLGNDVQIFTDPSKVEGLSGAHIVDRNPTVEVDPDLVNLNSQDWFSRWTNETKGALVLEVGDNLQVTSSGLQVNKTYSPGDREGHVVNNTSFIITDDNLRLLQGVA